MALCHPPVLPGPRQNLRILCRWGQLVRQHCSSHHSLQPRWPLARRDGLGSHLEALGHGDGDAGTHLQGNTGIVFSIAFSPDGKWVVSGNSDQTVRMWNTETGELVHTLRGHSFQVYRVVFRPDGKTIISVSPALLDNKPWLSQMEMIVRDASTGRQLDRTIAAYADLLWGGVAFSPDCQYFAAGGDKDPVIGDTTTGQCIHTLAGHSKTVYDCTFRPDGKVVATAGRDQTIRLWDRSTGKAIHTLRGHAGPVKSVVFSPDGTQLASGGEDTTVRLWDTVGGKEIATFQGHKDHVQSVAFSPDGHWVASASYDGTVRLWDALRGAEPVTLQGHTGWPSDVMFSPDGGQVFSFRVFTCWGAGWD